VLDFSKIEAGKLQLNPEPFDLLENLGTTMKTLAMRAHGKDIEFVFRVARDVPPVVIGDALRLRQIIMNLVGNAIKFTEDGEIVLFVDRAPPTGESRDGEPPSADQVVLRFRVVDTGIGIPADVRHQIFDAFEQADSSTTRRYGGTGLGLAITTQLVRAMNGHIDVESKVGQGSTFHFTCAFGVGPPLPEPDKEVRERLAGRNVLIVDDNAANRDMLGELIEHSGMLTKQADGGNNALRQCRDASARGKPFDLVITDLEMPEVSGYELVAAIRETMRPDPKIVVMTTGVRRGDLEWCQELDVSAHLLKPVKRSELQDAVVRTLLGISIAKRRPKQGAAKENDTAELCSLHILVAEDSPVNQKLAAGLLERENHRVTIASNGREAVLAVKSQSFDLVLMDVQMPDMDGIEATALIREMEQTTNSHIPIIAMTAHAMPGDRERCLAAGMDGYVSKPIRVKELYREISPFVTDSPIQGQTP
jgi:CheY-like chemotaxis protein